MTKETKECNANTTASASASTSPAFPFLLPSPSEPKNIEEAKALELAAQQRKDCNTHVRSGLTSNVTIQFLMEKLVGMGCTPPKGFISCIDCGDKKAGAGFGVIEETILAPSRPSNSNNNNNNNNDDHSKYQAEANERRQRQCDQKATMQDLQQQIIAGNTNKAKLRLLPEIFLCQQHIVNADHAHQSMVHELIHAIDLCRTNMDPINNCIHMACTEIRAENLSGECNVMREAINGRISNFNGHGAECVKRRAVLSVEANPNCKAKSREYVDAAFERCFRDTFPFDRHPNLR